MTITPSQVFSLAEELLERSDEVSWKASAGRSFYAAYYIVKPLFDELYTGPELRGGVHEKIIDFFQNYQGDYGAEFSRKINQIGSALFGLRILRTKADYRSDKDFSKNDCEQAFKTARRIEECADEAYSLKRKNSA